MRRPALVAIGVVSLCVTGTNEPVWAQMSDDLAPPSAFEYIERPAVRSAALFVEAGKVFQSPRCLNCHPVERLPTQGEDLHLHVPFMPAGAANHGIEGMPCAACHSEQNAATLGQRIKSVPGNAHWQLAPRSMAWQGLSLAEICDQLKDPARNGNRTLEQIHRHVMTDSLVAWGWEPGDGRVKAPGTLAQFGALVAAWIETGAHCPAREGLD